MDENKEELTTKEIIALTAFIGTAAFSAYQLVKLGMDWCEEIQYSRKNKTNKD